MPARLTESTSKISATMLPHQEELQQLGDLAGIHMDSKVFRILVELLNMGVDPTAIFSMLKDVRRSRSTKHRASLQLPTRRSASRSSSQEH